MYSGFRNVRHFPRCSCKFPDQWINTTAKLLGKKWSIEFLCVLMSRIMQKKSLFILQRKNMILSQNTENYCLLMVIVTLTTSSEWKMPDSQCKSEWEVEWNYYYIKVTRLLCFKRDKILQSVSDAVFLVYFHSIIL